MFRYFFITFLAAVSAVAHAQPAPCGPVTVGKSGRGAECSEPTLQLAINRALDNSLCFDNEIWITDDVAPTFFTGSQSIDTGGQALKIVGGFTSTGGGGCRNLARTGRSRLSGAGGATDSVLAVTGKSFLTLEHLDIVGGDEGPTDDGGGIDFKGVGKLELSNVNITDNKAGYGAGIFARGEGGTDQERLFVYLGDNVLVADNDAARNGGGLHVSGKTQLAINGNGVGIWSNEALAGEEGYGGGLYLRSPAFALVTAGGIANGPVFFANRAVRGGAIALRPLPTEGGTSLILSPHDTTHPMIVQNNYASVEAGAIYTGTDYAQGDVREASFCAFDTAFRDNEAPRGAALYSSYGTDSLGEEEAQGDARINSCNLANPSNIRCEGNRQCSEFSGNRAVTAAGQRTDGDIIEFSGSHGEFHATRTRFRNNLGGSVIRLGDDDENRLVVTNSIFAENDLSEAVIDSDANSTYLRHLTIARNALSGSEVLRVVESADPALDASLNFSNSIVDQPGKTTLRHEGQQRGQSVLQYVMSHEVSSMWNGAAGADPTLYAGDALLASCGPGCYQPSDNSPALDFASPRLFDGGADNLGIDFLVARRDVDLPTRGMAGSPAIRDLGAIERQSVIDRPDLIFKNGFGTDSSSPDERAPLPR